jgi:hypothetical protein
MSVLKGGFRTRDLARAGERTVNTEEMGAQVAEFVRMAAMTTSSFAGGMQTPASTPTSI